MAAIKKVMEDLDFSGLIAFIWLTQGRKPKRLVFVRIFLFRSAGSKITYFPTAPFLTVNMYKEF